MKGIVSRKLLTRIVSTIIVFLFWGSLIYPGWAQELPKQQPKMSLTKQQLEAFADSFFETQMNQLHIPGAAFTLVENGEIVLSKGYGFADIQNQLPVTPNKTLFRLGSISKLFTATAVMQLAERGQVSLNDNIDRYLDKVHIDKTYSKPITFANLLTHTDGIDSGWAIGAFEPSASSIKPLAQYVANKRLPSRIFPPGNIFFYGDVGMVLAGYLVEKIAQMPFEKYIEQNILQPLEMKNSSFEQPLPSKLQIDLATGYKYSAGGYQSREFAFNQNVSAAAFMATAEDMAHFAIAHLQNGRYKDRQILQQKTVKIMHERQFTHHSSMPGTAYGFQERWVRGRRAIEHSGRMNGYTSLLFLLPDENLGFFVACNNNAGALIDNLTEELLKKYYPEPQKVSSPTKNLTNSQNHLQQLSGTYRSIHYPHSTIEKLGAILGEATEVQFKVDSQGFLTRTPDNSEWIEIAPDLFEQKMTGIYMTYRRDERDRVTHLFTGKSVFSAWEKLNWYETKSFQFKLAATCILLFLLTCIVEIIRLITRRFKPSRRIFKKAQAARFLAFFVSLAYLFFLGGMSWFVFRTDFWKFFYELPAYVVALLYLPQIAVLLTVSLVICTVLAWRDWSVLNRIYHLSVALAALAFIPFLTYWNLLGFKF